MRGSLASKFPAVKALALMAAFGSLMAAVGCGDSDPRGSSPPAAPTPSSPPNVWASEADTLGLGAAPAFPATLDGWKAFGDEWSLTVRAFEGEWSPMSGPDYEGYPATMNGCDSARSLVRWRVIPKGVRIRASWQHATAEEGVAMGDSLTGVRGWMILDGCQIPQFQFVNADGEANLADVVVAAQIYEPAA